MVLYARHIAAPGIVNGQSVFSPKAAAVFIRLLVILSAGSNFNSVKHLISQYRHQPLQALVTIPEAFYRLDKELTEHGVLKDDALLCIGRDDLSRGQRLNLWFGRRIYTIYTLGAVPTPEKVTALLERRPEIEYLFLSKQFPNAETLQDFLVEHYPKEELSDVYLFRVKGVDHEQ